MAPLRNSLQLLKLSKGDPMVQEEAREAMDRQLAQLVRLVDDLLDITRINHNKLELRKTIIDLRTAVENAVETARPEIDANGHRLRVILPPQPVYVDGDLTRLAQVFWNLLSNSAKYTEPGGEILFSAETDGGNAVICVQDNGIGIPADSLPSLFEMFSQVDRSLERAQGGLGIGLALVRSLVQAHGGHVQVHSQGKNQGSRFVVSLPLAHGPPAHEKTVTPTDLSQSASRRILIVDDNRDGAASMARLLTSMGNETRVAFDGLAGVELAEAFRPEVIILDIGLPKLNGYDACRRIRGQPWGKDVLIIAATGWSQAKDRQRSEEAGFNYHLVKPLNPDELERVVANASA